MGCTASKSDTVDSNEVKLVKAKGGDAEAASNGIESTPSAAEATENVFNKLWRCECFSDCVAVKQCSDLCGT